MEISPRAFRELQKIFAYIETDSIQNAAGMIKDILDAIDSLEALPYRFSVLRKGGGLNLRRVVVHPYLVFYRIREKRKLVQITSIQHGSQQNFN